MARNRLMYSRSATRLVRTITYLPIASDSAILGHGIYQYLYTFFAIITIKTIKKTIHVYCIMLPPKNHELFQVITRSVEEISSHNMNLSQVYIFMKK
jgi:hypothetical protein